MDHNTKFGTNTLAAAGVPPSSPGNNALAALGGLGAALSNVVNTTATTSGDPFLRLMKDGGWVYGAGNTEVEPGSLWCVNPLSIKHGYAAWTRKDQKLKQKDELLAEAMVPATLPKPDLGALNAPNLRSKREYTDFGNVTKVADWAEQVSFQLQCISGVDSGEQTLYKTTSVGGKNASVTLLGAIIARIAEATDGTVVPVITLESGSYQHPQYGKTYFPIFNVQRWVGMDQAPKAEDLGPAPEEAPPFAQDTAATGAPVRRRRN